MCSNCDCDRVPKEVGLTSQPESCCKRCGADPFIILDKVHIFCKKCLLESCNKKIRSTIGKSKLVRNNDRILIAYSGGSSSSALLDLIKNSIQYETRREQRFRPSILHVCTESALNPNSSPEARLSALTNLLQSIYELYPDWPIYWSTLEVAALHSDSPLCADQTIYHKYQGRDSMTMTNLSSLLLNDRARFRLLKLMESLDMTDRERYVKDQTISSILDIANKINLDSSDPDDLFKFVFTGSNTTRLANNLLVEVILGSGANIRSTVDVCNRKTKVPIFRPMREFSDKEVAFYLRARGVNFHFKPNLSTLADKKASIQKLTESFLSKLYVEYPSTYSTLLKTGDKMKDV